VARYVIRRLLLTVPVMLGVTLVVFLAMNVLPGDAVEAMFAISQANASQETVQNMRHQLGLDDPLYVQYARFVGHAATGNLGRSIESNKPVVNELASQFPSTLELAVAGLGLAVVLGLLLGIIAALKHGTWLDNATMVLALVSVSVPSFWFGLLLILTFSLYLGWFPLTGGNGGLSYLVLPAVTLGLRASAVIARLTRSSLLDVLGEDYIRTARAKGLGTSRVVTRHALKNALIPVVTIVGLQFGHLLAGTVIIEMVFARQGVGQLIVNSILARDYPVVQGAVLFLALIFVLVNLAVDLLYAYLNPMIRYR
jgi:peptide/nickel transport system permease protein/oligopeptide transport system permease protein